MNSIVEKIKEKDKNLNDVYFRKITYKEDDVYLVFSDAMVDTQVVSNFVVRSINEILREKSILNDNNDNFKKEIDLREKILDKIQDIKIDLKDEIAISKINGIDEEYEEIFKYIFSGFVVIIYLDKLYAVEARQNTGRAVLEPSTDSSIRGPRDSFVENIMQNLALIRNRIKSSNLLYKEKEIGTRTKTKCALMYIEDIAKEEFVNMIEDKINSIIIDGILDINYIQEFINEENESSFPVSITTQRPDVVSYYLLQGRIVVLVNNSPYALILPAFFDDFINNIDDVYQNSKNVTITKIIRYISMILTIMVPALYLSLITFDQETIPTELLISISSQRESVPFPAVVEATMMIVAFEILKESDMRANKISGNTLSIVGAIILGDAAVSAGIVSPIMIIVVAITTISGLMFSDINVINAFRRWRLIFMIFASLCGITGMGMATILFVTSLVSTQSLTLPFTYPVAPLNITETAKKLFSRKNISKDKNRQKILTNNLTKGR